MDPFPGIGIYSYMLWSKKLYSMTNWTQMCTEINELSKKAWICSHRCLWLTDELRSELYGEQATALANQILLPICLSSCLKDPFSVLESRLLNERCVLFTHTPRVSSCVITTVSSSHGWFSVITCQMHLHKNTKQAQAFMQWMQRQLQYYIYITFR